MIRIFEEYVEFRTIPDEFKRQNSYFDGGSKNLFNFEDYAYPYEIPLVLNGFIQSGWYRIKFDDNRNVVVRALGVAYGHQNGSVFAMDDFSIQYDKIYKSGEIKNIERSGIKFNLKGNHYINQCGKKNTIIEKLYKPNKNRHLDDPYDEEIWDEIDESIQNYGIYESKKKKRIIGKLRNKAMDPYDEEDWGWDINHQINDDDFKGKYIIFKLGGEFYFDILKNHYTIGFRDTLRHRLNPERYGISLNIFQRHGQYVHPREIKFARYLVPMTEREIERIKKDRIQILPYGGGHKIGINDRTAYSELKKDVLFLDQEYMDKYLYGDSERDMRAYMNENNNQK